MMQKKLEVYIQKWISENKGLDIEEVDVLENFFHAGYIDSLGMFRLIFDIETEFDIRIDQDALFNSTETNIASLSKTIEHSIPNP